jgi:hypothetical protein
MSWHDIGWLLTIIFIGAVCGSIGYSMGMDRGERDERERNNAQREQRQREVEVDRKDAGLPPLYPEARKVVDTNDAKIDADERRLKKLGLVATLRLAQG